MRCGALGNDSAIRRSRAARRTFFIREARHAEFLPSILLWDQALRFLCIDDEALNLQVLTDMLQVAGASVSPHLDAEAALIDLAVNVYDMILVDLRMPGMDGVCFIEHVR